MRGPERSERPMRPGLIDAELLHELLSFSDAIDVLEAAFSAPLAETPQRSRIETPSGEMLLMPAIGSRYAGVKLVTVAPGNAGGKTPVVQAVYALFDAVTLSPLCVVDGTALTSLRTGAVSGLATRHLAKEDARSLVIFGAGAMGNAHLDAMLAVRDIGSVRIVSRTRDRADRLAERAGDMGLDSKVAGPEAVRYADLICTCTTSDEPVFDGSLLPAGAHVNAVGAYRPEQREIDDETVRKALIVVETREAALEEAGDLLVPMASGVIGRDAIVADLAEVVRGERVRRSPEDVTVFKSVGVGFEDLVVASAAYERYQAQGEP